MDYQASAFSFPFLFPSSMMESKFSPGERGGINSAPWAQVLLLSPSFAASFLFNWKCFKKIFFQVCMKTGLLHCHSSFPILWFMLCILCVETLKPLSYAQKPLFFLRVHLLQWKTSPFKPVGFVVEFLEVTTWSLKISNLKLFLWSCLPLNKWGQVTHREEKESEVTSLDT